MQLIEAELGEGRLHDDASITPQDVEAAVEAEVDVLMPPIHPGSGNGVILTKWSVVRNPYLRMVAGAEKSATPKI